MTRTLLTGLIALACSCPGLANAADDEGFVTIYAGPQDAERWITNNGRPVPAANASAEGLNPHGSGGYLVVYNEPVKDFVLDFEYKLSPGCNSGVFLRVGNLRDPVMTGLEVAIDDTTGAGYHDSGAIYDLVKPTKNAQKPAGEWNHMRIVARGPVVEIVLNGEAVTRIDQSEWTQAGQRPDGSRHKFSNVAINDLNQKGHFGFQDHGQDCWYRNVRLKVLD
jgi:hypothetical protein